MHTAIPTAGRTLSAALLLGLSVFAQDDCATAAIVVNGTNGPFSNVGATNSTTLSGAPAPTCVASSFDMDIWFMYVASCTGSATFSLCSMTSGDTVMAVYDGSGGCGALTQLGCNDDSCAARSTLSVPVTSGGVYYVRLDTFSTPTLTTFQLDISCVGGGPPVNDECSGALPLALGVNTGFSNVSATNSTTVSGAPAPTCEASSFDRDIWFSHVATCTGIATFATCPMSSGDTVMAVYDGSAGCGALTQVGCNDDSCGTRSTVTTPVTAGTTYYVRVDTFGTSGTLTFDIDVTCTAIAANDNCAGALPLTLGLNTGLSNVGATVSTPGLPCSFSAAPVNDVWFSYTATCTAPHTFSTCTGALSDTVIEVLDDCTLLTSLGCNDDDCGLRSSVTVSLTNGTNYLVRTGGWNGATGSFEINVATGTGTGSQAVDTVSTCAGGLSLAVTGNFNIGGSVSMTMTGATATAVVAYGFLPHFTLPCGCLVITGGDGQLGSFTFGLGTSTTIAVPCDPILIGLAGMLQGFDLHAAGTFPPCTVGPFDVLATDIIAVTLG